MFDKIMFHLFGVLFVIGFSSILIGAALMDPEVDENTLYGLTLLIFGSLEMVAGGKGASAYYDDEDDK